MLLFLSRRSRLHGQRLPQRSAASLNRFVRAGRIIRIVFETARLGLRDGFEPAFVNGLWVRWRRPGAALAGRVIRRCRICHMDSR
jgi:hypothetical protein